MFRQLAIIPLLLPAVVAAAEVSATRPTTVSENTADWLDHALREAANIEDAVLRSEAYAKAAVLMARLGDVPRYKRTIALAEQALASATTKPAESPVKSSVDAATTAILGAMVQGGDVTGAKAFADERAQANKYFRPIYYATIAGKQAAAGDVEDALTTAAELNEYDRRPVLKQIVSALAAKREFAEAERVAAMMEEKDMERRDAVRAIAAGRAQAGEYEAALAMADQLPYAHDKQAVYNYVLDAQIESGDWPAAHATAAAMPLDEKRPLSPNPPDHARTRAYAKIAWALLKRDDIPGARETGELLDRDQKAQLESAIAKAHIEKGDLAAAREAADAISPDAMRSFDRSPRVEAHEAVAAALARAGKIDEAVEVARLLPQSAEALLDVAEVAVVRGKLDEARKLLEELNDRVTDGQFSELGFVANLGMIRLRIARLEKALGNPAAYEAAVADLKQHVEEPVGPEEQRTAAMQLFGLYIAEDDFESARRLVPALGQERLTLAIAVLADAAARAGKTDRAKALAEFMPTPEERAAVLQAILRKYLEAPATPAEAVARIGRLPSAYDRSRAYLARAEALWVESQRGR